MEGKISRSSQRKAARRNAILEAAYEKFSQNGYSNTRIEEIAIAAGVGKGTVYEYFPSKMALFQQVLEWKQEENLQQIFFHLDPDNHSVEEVIYPLVRSYIDNCIQNRDITFLIMKEMPFMGEELKDWFLKKQIGKEEEFCSHVKDAIQKGHIRNVNTDAMLILFGGLLATLHMSIAMGRYNEENMEDLARGITDILLKGIQP